MILTYCLLVYLKCAKPHCEVPVATPVTLFDVRSFKNPRECEQVGERAFYKKAGPEVKYHFSCLGFRTLDCTTVKL
jgi:hypothetical protein